MCDKIRALELLGRHLGLFKDRLVVDLSADIAARIMEGRKRVSDARKRRETLGSADTSSES